MGNMEIIVTSNSEGILMESVLRKVASPTFGEELNICRCFVTDFQKLRSELFLIQYRLVPSGSSYDYVFLRRHTRYLSGYCLAKLSEQIDELGDEVKVYTCRQRIDKLPSLTLLPTRVKLLFKLKRILETAYSVTSPPPSSSPMRKKLETLVRKLLAPGSEMREELQGLVRKLLAPGSETPSVIAKEDSTPVKRVYNRVHAYFDLTIWVPVNGILDAAKTMNDILRQRLSEDRPDEASESLPSELRSLQSLLRESLQGKRYLLVLDNVTYVEQAEWDKLKDSLSSGSFGSKLIVTSHAPREVTEPMRTPRRPVDPALHSSFKNLPLHQQLCFCYFSEIPSHYKINREKLIHQWVALGFIPSTSGKHMEETGAEYFHSILSTFSPFLAISTDGVGELQEFAFDESSSQIKSYLQEVHRTGPWFLTESSRRRTFNLICQNDISMSEKHSLFKLLKHHRVLNLSGCGIRRLHESIGDLIYLRYLDLSNTPIQNLPKNICYLFNLQTLHLSDCKYLKELPRKISNLINLRHLNIKGCESLTRMPPNIGKLEKLQTLPIFIIGEELEQSLFQLKHLDLRGELEIRQLERAGYMLPEMCLECKLLQSLVLSWSKDDEAKMNHYTSGQASEGYNSNYTENVVNCLVPNRSLKKLSINEYPGSTLPQWLNKILLPNLTKLELFNCRRCATLPPLGPLQSLRVLHLQGMDAVVTIGSEFFGTEPEAKQFSSLCELILRDFPALTSWESTEFVEVFPSLHKLSIINCPVLTSIPSFQSLQHLDINNCSKLILGRDEGPNLSSNLPSKLQNLEISSCTELQEFPDWIVNLTSLQSLAVLNCQNLKSLPEDLKHLQALQCLSVKDCPHLERRCLEDRGEDWHKILHIPSVNVGSSMPQKRVDGATDSSS